jgi:hypothetical protein
MALRWKDIPEIEGFCSDRDVKSMSVIHDELKWMVTESLSETMF